MRYLLPLLFLGCFFGSLSAASPEPDPIADRCMLQTTFESMVAGLMIPVDQLAVHFDVTQGEFTELLAINQVTAMKLEVIWTKNDGSAVDIAAEENIANISQLNVESWTLIFANADTLDGTYSVRISLNEEKECGEGVVFPIVKDTYVEVDPELPINLPNFECGETFDPDQITNSSPLASAISGDLFYIRGFPIMLQTVSGSNGTFSGTGIVPLPFGKKIVAVTFINVTVNDDYQITAGEVVAASDNHDFYNDFQLNNLPLSIGGDICLENPPIPGYDSEGVDAVTGLDDWGFNPATGLNSETGTAYDSLGFDVNGNHNETMSPYNNCGCSREGVDEEDNPCDPGCGPFAASEAFADSIAGTLNTDITAIGGTLTADLQTEINQLDCGSIRSELNTLVTSLGFDRTYIFGENDEYLNAGLHTVFEKEPKPTILNTNRNPQVKELETKHIALFNCDKAEYNLAQLLAGLNGMSTADYEELTQHILGLINNWSEYQYGLYADDSQAYNEWLVRKIGDWLREQNNIDNSTGAIDRNSLPWYAPDRGEVNDIFDFNRRGSSDVQWASLNARQTALFNEELAGMDLGALFRNGNRTIKGVSRAFYLEELARQQKTTTGDIDYLMPIEISKTAGNITYTIYLDEIRFTPNGAHLSAYIIIEDPETGQRFAFSGHNIGFGPTGTDSESILYLENDIEIRLNNAAMLVLRGGENTNTYVAWDCKGFKSLGIDGQVEFCRDFITPLDEQTLMPLHDSIRYRLDVSVQDITSWLEFSVTINAKPFAMTKHENIKWQLTNMVLDFSSTTTPDFVPLAGYTSPYWDETSGVMSPLWKGFYMETLSATLPNEFNEGGDTITIGVNDLLIDGRGVSGEVFVGYEILSINEGNMSGWPFSIDSFSFRVLNNQLVGGGMAGELNIPIFDDNCRYEAYIYPGNYYSFAISPLSAARSDLFVADVTLLPNSKIQVEYSETEGFHAVATLYGDISVGDFGSEGIDVSLPKATFQGMKISNKSPYFQAGLWGIVDDAAPGNGMGGFPISLSGLELYKPDNIPNNGSDGANEVGLKFQIGLNLSDGVDVSATGAFSIDGVLEEVNGRQRWKYEKFSVDAIYVDASFPSATIEGILEWYDDSNDPVHPNVWGKGFRGMLNAEFTEIGIGGIQAAAQFGSISGTADDYSYFFVDVMVDLGQIGNATGPLKIKGFGGGVSYHMDVNAGFIDFGTTSSGGSLLPPLGVSFSGAVYTPDSGTKLALKASAIIATAGQEDLFNGTVSILFQFGENNSIQKIALLGSGQFLKGLDPTIKSDHEENSTSAPSSVSAPIAAFASIEFDFEHQSFHGSLDVFVNVANGLIEGKQDGGKMVAAVIHFDPTEWYIHVGTPQLDPNGPVTTSGLYVNIPLLGRIESSSYFCMGTNVPPSPPLPANVRAIAYKFRDNSSLRQSGAGMIFGAALGIRLEAKVPGIASAQLDGQFGFDVMLRKYSGFVCQNTGEPIGIDGWYASGQAYAYVSGELKVFGVNIASAAVVAALQARLPNPFFAQAVLGIRVKIGFVKVNKNLELRLGNDDCILVSTGEGSEIGMDIILALDPLQGDGGVETLIEPKATLSLELDKNYELPSISNNQTYAYRAKFVSATLTQQSTGQVLPSERIYMGKIQRELNTPQSILLR